MHTEWWEIAFLLGFGAVLAIHCLRAGWKELRSGVAKDQFGAHTRAASPLRFWVTIVFTFFAGAVGAVFLLFGCVVAALKIG
jgi:hypothetical protein